MVTMGLSGKQPRKGSGILGYSGLVPRTSRPVDPEPFRLAAKSIVEQLKLAGVRCYRKLPSKGHGMPGNLRGASPDVR